MKIYIFIKNKIFIFIFIFLITGCSQIVNIILAPITIPTTLILHATKKEPYYNPNYILPKECTKEILQIMTIETGISINEYTSIIFEKMITEIIHTKTKDNDSVTIGMNTNAIDNNLYFILENEKTNKKFFYLISSSSKNLELVLSGYTNGSYAGPYMDTYRGHKIDALENCPIN